ncbi:hypothetical protein Sru01_49560 [Sphaerisporangium rufum]|uniref:Uncharacterized protein n=1 Tax=Sphaerisporangium rufum TaxID=1381558 RepID=A0A919R5E1_9ACTN|nr:hypothetical protein Sru01_49560 [Sphaerisporangium rufum]
MIYHREPPDQECHSSPNGYSVHIFLTDALERQPSPSRAHPGTAGAAGATVEIEFEPVYEPVDTVDNSAVRVPRADRRRSDPPRVAGDHLPRPR